MLPKLSNVEDTQYEQKFVLNKYYCNYIMITNQLSIDCVVRQRGVNTYAVELPPFA